MDLNCGSDHTIRNLVNLHLLNPRYPSPSGFLRVSVPLRLKQPRTTLMEGIVQR